MLCHVEQSTITLESILENPSSEIFKEFSTYLQQSYCIENLEFWIEAKEYKECRNNKLIEKRCEKMINDYIRPNSPQEINIPCDMRQTILEFYKQKNYHPTLFGDAAEAVLELMRINSFLPWLMYKKNDWDLVKMKDSFDYHSDNNQLFLTTYSTHSVYKSMFKKLKKSLSPQRT